MQQLYCYLLVYNFVPHLMSFPFVFCEVNDGVRQCGGARLHLLHHHLPGAVDGQDVAGEVLAGPPHCTTGRAGDWTGGENEGQLNLFNQPGCSAPTTYILLFTDLSNYTLT